MLAVKVRYKLAEVAKRFLLECGIYDKAHLIAKDKEFIYFPITKKAKLRFVGEIVNKNLEKAQYSTDWKKSAIESKLLNKSEIDDFVSAFDVMGDIAVIEIPDKLEKKQREIAGLLLKAHKNLKVVAKKTSAVKGKYRIKGLVVIAGEKRLITTYRENGCLFKIDLSKVYFSPRLSFERNRIARLVKKGEKVLALFAGAGFYPIIIAKFQPECKIVGVELNKIAVKYMEENIKLNKMDGKIIAIGGDVAKVLSLPKYKRWATRAVMPLPHLAHEFLDATLNACRKNATIHFYYIPVNKTEDAILEARELIKNHCRQMGRKFKIIFSREVKTYAPGRQEVVLDAKLLN